MRQFEISWPFDKIAVGAFFDAVRSIEIEDEKGKCTESFKYSDLAGALQGNAAWQKALASPDTPTSRILLHEDFRRGGEDCIDTNHVEALALLHCAKSE